MTAVGVHALVDGPDDAPVVLLAGSLGSTLAMWEPQVAALKEQFRVVRYDARGHGASSVPPGPYTIDDLVDDAVGLLDRLAIERAHFVGLSLGGMTALRLAAREPARVQRLVVLCTSAHLGPARQWSDRAATVRPQGTAAVQDAVVSRWFTPSFARSHAGLADAMRAMVGSTPAEGYAACCEAIAGTDLRAELPGISAPVLSIAGADDPATPPPHLAAIAEQVSSGQLLVLPEAAHLASLEQAPAVNAAILTFLAAPGERAQRSAGMAVRRAVLGDAHVDHAAAGTSALTADFQDFITRYAWGDVWSRPCLDRPTRSKLTLALLAALGQQHELGMHVRAAVRNGVTPQEISEVLLHTAVYAGVPAANSAFAVAQQVLGELGLDRPLAAHTDEEDL